MSEPDTPTAAAIYDDLFRAAADCPALTPDGVADARLTRETAALIGLLVGQARMAWAGLDAGERFARCVAADGLPPHQALWAAVSLACRRLDAADGA